MHVPYLNSSLLHSHYSFQFLLSWTSSNDSLVHPPAANLAQDVSCIPQLRYCFKHKLGLPYPEMKVQWFWIKSRLLSYPEHPCNITPLFILNASHSYWPSISSLWACMFMSQFLIIYSCQCLECLSHAFCTASSCLPFRSQVQSHLCPYFI